MHGISGIINMSIGTYRMLRADDTSKAKAEQREESEEEKAGFWL